MAWRGASYIEANFELTLRERVVRALLVRASPVNGPGSCLRLDATLVEFGNSRYARSSSVRLTRPCPAGLLSRSAAR